jgi:hypothetical protein
MSSATSAMGGRQSTGIGTITIQITTEDRCVQGPLATGFYFSQQMTYIGVINLSFLTPTSVVSRLCRSFNLINSQMTTLREEHPNVCAHRNTFAVSRNATDFQSARVYRLEQTRLLQILPSISSNSDSEHLVREENYVN